MTADDIDAGLRLCRLSHWNQVARDWQQFLALAPHGATVAVLDEATIVGTVATVRYAEASPPQDAAVRRGVAWIAMVLVDPTVRGRGIGRALLARGLDTVADLTTVGLDATPLGQPLYETLGFRAEAWFTRMQRAGHGRTTPVGVPRHVRPASPDDLDAIAALDAAATGLDRRAMLAWLLAGAPDLAWVSGETRRVTGFALGRRGHAFTHLGPVIGASNDAAAALVGAAIARHPERPMVVDAADGLAGWRERLGTLGFDAQRPFARMYRGAWRPAGDASRLFAIIGPEFG